MYRFTRTVTVKHVASMPDAIKMGMGVIEHLRKEYGMSLSMGMEVYGQSKLHYYNDFESLDKVAEMQSKLGQDKAYLSIVEAGRSLFVEGSLHDKLVRLLV
jgi:hypothetical protein